MLHNLKIQRESRGKKDVEGGRYKESNTENSDGEREGKERGRNHTRRGKGRRKTCKQWSRKLNNNVNRDFLVNESNKHGMPTACLLYKFTTLALFPLTIWMSPHSLILICSERACSPRL